MNNLNQPKATYRFYIRTIDGTETEWRRLTRKQARDMYAYTDNHQPDNVTGYGWEETKPPITTAQPQNS